MLLTTSGMMARRVAGGANASPLSRPGAQKKCILPDEVSPLRWQDETAEVLFHACAERSDPSAWDEFVRRYGALLERTAYRVAQGYGNLSPELVDDLVQDCYVRLCADNTRALRVFQPTQPGAEFGYLKVVAAHAATDFFRRRKRARSDVPLEEIPEPAAGNTDLDREILLQEVDACLLRITEGSTRDRDLMVFRLHYVQGLTAQSISAIPAVGLTCKGVESLLGRLRQTLSDSLRRKSHPREGVPL